MGLGLPVKPPSGDFMSLCKFDARAGRMFRVDRVERNGTFEKNDVEVTQGFAAIFDLKNIEVGYVKFNEGGAPEWAMVKIGQPLPAKPSQDFRQGFRVNIKLAKSIGGDVREFASAAGCVISAMDQLYDAYSKAPEAVAGRLPIVTMNGSTPIKSGSGARTSTNYSPNFTITQWVDRPAELAGSAAPAPLSTPSPTVPAPVASPQPAQTAAVQTEF
jgi:hypothetical protein